MSSDEPDEPGETPYMSFVEWAMALVDALFEKYGITPKKREDEKP